MKKFISAKLAGNILLFSLGLLLVFHILVLLKIVPADIMWSGQANSGNLIALEIIALVVTLFFGFIIAAKAGSINAGKFVGIVNILVWVIFIFLLLNTLGNLASGVSFENLIFAPITIVLALCAFRLAIEK
jgi:predicted membrane-bound spermidine synthase